MTYHCHACKCVVPVRDMAKHRRCGQEVAAPRVRLCEAWPILVGAALAAMALAMWWRV